eukprot:gene12622-14814_t
MTDRFLQVLRNIVLSREIFRQVKAIHRKLGLWACGLASVTYEFIKNNRYHHLCLDLFRHRTVEFVQEARLCDQQRYLLSIPLLRPSDLKALVPLPQRCLDSIARNPQFIKHPNHPAIPSIDLFTAAHTLLQSNTRNLIDQFLTIDTIHSSILSGNIALVEYVFRFSQWIVNSALWEHGKLVNLAVCSGSLAVIEFLATRNISTISQVDFDQVALNGHISMFQHFANHPQLRSSKYYSLRDYTDPRAYYYVDDKPNSPRGTITPFTIAKAARGGHIDLVRYLHLNRSEGGADCTLAYAIASKDIDTTRYIYENNIGSCQSSIGSTFIHGLTQSFPPDIQAYLLDQATNSCHINPLFMVRLLKRSYGATCTKVSKLVEAKKYPIITSISTHKNDLFALKSLFFIDDPYVPRLTFKGLHE